MPAVANPERRTTDYAYAERVLAEFDELSKETNMQGTSRGTDGRYQRGSSGGGTQPQTKPQLYGPKRQQWDQLVQKYRDRGLSPARAVAAANKENESLRLEMLSEVNGKRIR